MALLVIPELLFSFRCGGNDKAYNFIPVNFNASRSNPIYGNSDTVQSPAIRVNWCIQVYNTVTELSKLESTQLARLIQMKAQVDFSNVTENLDFVVESWRSEDGLSWYRKYRSGWIEQGGCCGFNGPETWHDVQITFPIEFSNRNYSFVATGVGGYGNGVSIENSDLKTTTGVVINVCDSVEISSTTWFACGMAATE